MLSVHVSSYSDAQAILAWCSQPKTHPGSRKVLLAGVAQWLTTMQLDMARREREQTDREYGTVALLREAAVLVGQAVRA